MEARDRSRALGSWARVSSLGALCVFAACGGSNGGGADFGSNTGPSSSSGSGSGGGDDASSGGSGGASSSGSASGGSSASGAGGSSSGSTSGSSGGHVDAGHDASGGSSSGSSGGGTGTKPTLLPTAMGTCPTLATGNSVGISLNGKSMPWTLYVGSKASSPTGPIIIYWHGTGTSGSADVGWGIGQAAISSVMALGGVVAAAESTSSTGTNTGDGVWYTGDVDWADFIIACAIQQLNIDTRHIHASGYSAGALQTGYMYYARSGYLASVVVYSGGAGIGAGTFQDPTNVAPLIGAHGAPGGTGCTLTSTNCDLLAGSTTMFEQAAKAAGAPIVVDCNDGGAHTDITRLTRLAPSTWQFFKDHPFKQGKPDPYAGGLPAGFPTYCAIQ